jgi:hypothetical protein
MRAYLATWRGIPSLLVAALLSLTAVQLAALACWLADHSERWQDRGNAAREGLQP